MVDVKMWHVGVHIWDVDPNEIEPNYDEWYRVSLMSGMTRPRR